MRRVGWLIAVVTVIGAFLGMHAIAMPEHASASASASASGSAFGSAFSTMTMTSHTGAPAKAMGGTDVGSMKHAAVGTTGPSHTMTAMACAMTLLIAAAGIILARARIRLTPRHEAFERVTASTPVTIFAGHPPSLTKLSISRT